MFVSTRLKMILPGLQKPKPPTPGMDSPRGERSSGLPESPLRVLTSPSLSYSGARSRSPSDRPESMIGMQCSPSVAFPLETIKESSTSPCSSEDSSPRDAHQLADVRSGAGVGKDGMEVDQNWQGGEPARRHASSASYMSSGEPRTGLVLILDGRSRAGSHTSIRGSGQDANCSHRFLTPPEACCQSFHPNNLEWRVTL